ncbi:MAG: hypothetical protein AB1567_13095 [bacterium]
MKKCIKHTLKFLACWISWGLLVIYTILPTINLRLKFLSLFSWLALNIKPIFALRLPPKIDTEDFGDSVPENVADKDVCVLFSGGSDSTLVASIMAEHFRYVYLLTYKHCGISTLENSEYNLKNLCRKYGDDKFIHKKMDIDALFRKFYFECIFKDLKKYGVMSIVGCGTCKFVMHMQTIIFCLQNNIKFVSDASARFYGMMAPNETKPVLKLIKAMYKEYGINFIINPAYNTESSQKELAKKGIISEEEVIRKADYQSYKSTQPICHFGIFFILTLKMYFFYRWGVEQLVEASIQYYKDKIPIY